MTKDGGWLLPETINPPRRCLTIMVPDDPAHLNAFWGALQELGYWFNWQRDPLKKGVQVSSVWTEVIQEAHTKFYSEDPCEVDVSCADVADCIENDSTTRTVVQNIAQTAAGTAAQPGTTSTPGQRLPDTSWTANLTPTDDCSYDVFWAQCEQFVNYIVTAGTDLLEILETYSNAVEAGQFIEMAPIVGTLVDEVQIDVVLDFIDWCLDVIKETYEAADTQPNRQAIACALFCDMRHDCELSIDGAFNVINGRLGGILSPSDLNNPEALLNAAITLATNPAFPLDTWLAVVLALARVMSYLGVRGLDATLNIVLKIAVNDANNDWELLCTDCPATWCRHLDAAHGLGTLFTGTGGLGAQASWNGSAWVRNDAVAPGRITIGADLGAVYEITAIRIVRTGAWTGGDTNTTTLYAPTFATVIATGAIPADLEFDGLSLNVQTFQIDEVSSVLVNEDPIGGGITDIYIQGTGPEPSWGEAC